MLARAFPAVAGTCAETVSAEDGRDQRTTVANVSQTRIRVGALQDTPAVSIAWRRRAISADGTLTPPYASR